MHGALFHFRLFLNRLCFRLVCLCQSRWLGIRLLIIGCLDGILGRGSVIYILL